MNISRFISRGGLSVNGRSSRLSSRVAIISVAVSVAVMVVALSVTSGFKSEVSHKITLLAGDYSIVGHDMTAPGDYTPIDVDSSIMEFISTIEGVQYVFPEVTRGVVARDSVNMFGLTLRGVDSHYPTQIISPYITNGSFPNFNEQTDAVVISDKVAQGLGLEVGDMMELIYFSAIPIRLSLRVAATYSTGMEEVDRTLAFTSLEFVAPLAGIEPNQADAYQIIAQTNANLNHTANLLDEELGGYDMMLNITTDQYPQIFDWLNMLDNNITLLLIIMIAVAAVNMTAAVLSVILENTQTIGTLKSLGMKNRTIQTTFLITTLKTTTKGLAIGLTTGLTLALIQLYTNLIPLDPTSYMVDSVPININPIQIIILAAGTIITLTILTTIPTTIIYKLSPAKTMKFS